MRTRGCEGRQPARGRAPRCRAPPRWPGAPSVWSASSTGERAAERRSGALYRTLRSTNMIENLNASSVTSRATSAAGATAGCSSAGSVRRSRTPTDVSASCGATVISLPSSARSSARPWTAERRSRRNRHPSRRSPPFNSERDIPGCSRLGVGPDEAARSTTN